MEERQKKRVPLYSFFFVSDDQKTVRHVKNRHYSIPSASPQKMNLANKLVAWSGLVGLYIVIIGTIQQDSMYAFKVGQYIAVSMCLSTYRYHLVDCFHGQPPSIISEKELLEFKSSHDFSFFLAFFYCICHFYIHRETINTRLVCTLAFVGVSCLFISEHTNLRNRLFLGRHVGTQNVFAFFHSIWHLCAFALVTLATREDLVVFTPFQQQKKN